MKKKNIVGHMMAPEESVISRFRRWQILPRFWCLVLALVLWLVVTNLSPDQKERDEAPTDPPAVSTEV